MERTSMPTRESAQNPPLTSARVLLGTIAATGALALTAVVALAPTKEALLLIGALALPWVTAALTIGLPILIPASASRWLGTTPAPAMRPKSPIRSWRLAGTAAAVALLLLVGLIAQQSAEPTSSSDGATTAQTEPSSQVASVDISAD